MIQDLLVGRSLRRPTMRTQVLGKVAAMGSAAVPVPKVLQVVGKSEL